MIVNEAQVAVEAATGKWQDAETALATALAVFVTFQWIAGRVA
jgi:hypothetical protein